MVILHSYVGLPEGKLSSEISLVFFPPPPPSMRDVRGPNGKITSPSRPGSSLDPSHVIIDAPAGVIKHVWEIPGIN